MRSTSPSTQLPSTPNAWHKRVLQLTWPVILANVTIPLVGIADIAVMGRLPDPIYIAAVALGATLFSAVYWLFGFLRMGTTGLTAQALGQQELKQQELDQNKQKQKQKQSTADDAHYVAEIGAEIVAIFIRACIIAGTLGLLIILLQWPLRTLLFQLFDASKNVAELANIYYSIRIYGAPGLLIHLAQLGLLFGLQRMRETLWLSIGLNVTNLVLDVILVMVFDMGVAGVALGTAISEWGAAAFGFIIIIRIFKQHNWLSAKPARLLAAEKLMALLNVSGNLVIRTFFVQLPFFVGTVLATGLGDITLAVHGVLMQLFFIMTYTLDGFAHTAETLCGYCYGARNPPALRKSAKYSAIWGLGFAVATGAVFLIFGDAVVALLSTSDEVQQLAHLYLPWVAFAPLVCIWAFLLDGIFIGTTRIHEMRNSMILSALIWAVLLWLTFATWHYHAVWACMIAFMLLRSLFMGWYYPKVEAGAQPINSSIST